MSDYRFTESGGLRASEVATDLRALESYVPAALTPWVNKTVVEAARNGTTSHTITFAAATAGNLLAAVVAGPITSTITTTGWVKHSYGIAATEVGLHTKYATAGESSFTMTHNNPDRPANVVVYEFPPGTVLLNSRTLNSTPSFTESNPTLGHLSGSPTGFAFASNTFDAGVSTGTKTIDWADPVIDDGNLVIVGNGVTNGGTLHIGYQDAIVASSWTAAIAAQVAQEVGNQDCRSRYATVTGCPTRGSGARQRSPRRRHRATSSAPR